MVGHSLSELRNLGESVGVGGGDEDIGWNLLNLRCVCYSGERSAALSCSRCTGGTEARRLHI